MCVGVISHGQIPEGGLTTLLAVTLWAHGDWDPPSEAGKRWESPDGSRI